jgi:pyruvate dehydrogenase E1 component
LAPEGGAHQSVATPLIGIAQDGLAYFEPTYVDELAVILRWAFDYMQRDAKKGAGPWERDAAGGSVYLRLSTRMLQQPKRTIDERLARDIIDGGYWLHEPAEGAELAIVAMGAVLPEAEAAWKELSEEVPGAGLLAVTSADRLNAGWHAALKARQQGEPAPPCEVERLLAPLAPDAGLVTVLDGHPATLSWLGAVHGHAVQALGVEHFGQSGDLPDLYAKYRLDSEAILDAAAAALLRRARGL